MHLLSYLCDIDPIERQKLWNAMPLLKLTYPLSNHRKTTTTSTWSHCISAVFKCHTQPLEWMAGMLLSIEISIIKVKNEIEKKWEDWFTIVRMTNERMKELKALISFFVEFDVQHTESRQRYPSHRVSFRKKLITKSHDYSDYFPFKQRFFLNSLFLSYSLHFFTANRLILFQWVHVTKLISKFWISHMNIYFFFRVLVFDPNTATSMHESAFWWRWTKKSMRLYKNRRNYRAQSGVKPAQKISIMWKKRIIEGCNRQSQFTPSTFRVAI